MPTSRTSRRPSPAGFLGIEAGGTRTSALWVADDHTAGPLHTFGPANLQLLSDADLVARFREIASAFPTSRALGIGMAGARTAADRARIRAAAATVWKDTPCIATHDLDTALAADAAAGATDSAATASTGVTRVLILSGTGSCCYGRTPDGRTAKAGGWGHLLGDRGSGYAIALAGLRALIREYDVHGAWGPFGEAVLAHLHRNEPDALLPWIHAAPKSDLAALAPLVFAAAATDPHYRAVVASAARELAEAAVTCAAKLVDPRDPVRFVLAGGVLVHQPDFAQEIVERLHALRPKGPVTVAILQRPGAEGAAHLAREFLADPGAPLDPPAAPAVEARSTTSRRTAALPSTPAPTCPDPATVIPEALELSPTEQRNPRSTRLDRLSLSDAIDLMITEDRRLPGALRATRPKLERALRWIVRALKSGGRLFYVGAGTSGRLGVLDASECPPTFRTPPDLVQGVLAGGEPAMFRSLEGAEDDFAGGFRTMSFRGVTRRDVVVGIAASGRTPFVWGALAGARAIGARTVLVAFHPRLRFRPGHRPDAVITPRIGPEILTGSTRLKAGTATKQILNLFTTLAMVRLGKVVENLMVDVNPANAKLRERAVRIVRTLTQADEPAARAALDAAGWVVKDALRRLGRGRRGGG